MTIVTNPRELPNDVEALKAIVIAHRAELAQLDEQVRLLESENPPPAHGALREEERAARLGRHPARARADAPAFPELIEAAERVADEKSVRARSRSASRKQKRVPKRRKHFRRTCR
ncbi:MAG: hypothetical protein IPJ19_16545 [Planctomycetes bacterium]|nr:hypothetical protein [Planctomycetota bacterium]